MAPGNRLALVSGAGGGIGRAIVDALLDTDIAVVGLVRTPVDSRRARTSPELRTVRRIVADMRIPGQVRDAVEEAVSALGGLDILVNCAGVEGVASLEEITESYWDEVMHTNVRAPMLLCQAAVPHLQARGGGVIVNVASQAGHRGERLNSTYTASKFALVGLTQALAQELAPRRIRVNAVCPGPIETPLLERSAARFAELDGIPVAEVTNRIQASIPVGRLGQPAEVAGAVRFLCSPDAAFITGASLLVTGGVTMG